MIDHCYCVLIVASTVFGGASVNMKTFSDEQACLDAAKSVRLQVNAVNGNEHPNGDMSRWNVSALCVQR
jgi:hypothetical protein